MIYAILTILIVAAIFVSAWFNHRESYDKISFKDSLKLTGSPIIIFENNGRQLHFLLDTGSNRSIINNRELDTCIYKDTGKSAKNIGVEAQSRVLPYVEMPLEYDDKVYNELFLVRDLTDAFNAIKEDTGVTVHGLLGTSFFSKYKYVLDFDKLVAYSKKKL